MDIRVKVCGMKYGENLKSLINLHPDFIGFIFYPKSKRYVGEGFEPKLLKQVPESIKTVGVFVNESFENLIYFQEKFHFDYFQLHGDETSALCKKLKDSNYKVIKAFSIDSSFDFTILDEYKDVCDYFLFDTKGDNYGGNGMQFDWKILDNYKLSVQFFLSGGISPESVPEITNVNHPQLFAIDINSKFEEAPGLKDISKLTLFLEDLHLPKE